MITLLARDGRNFTTTLGKVKVSIEATQLVKTPIKSLVKNLYKALKPRDSTGETTPKLHRNYTETTPKLGVVIEATYSTARARDSFNTAEN